MNAMIALTMTPMPTKTTIKPNVFVKAGLAARIVCIASRLPAAAWACGPASGRDACRQTDGAEVS